MARRPGGAGCAPRHDDEDSDFHARSRFAPRALRRLIRRSSLIRNSGFIIATTVVNSGLGYLFWVAAAHEYAVASVGLAAALISAMTLASTMSSVGIGASMIQHLPSLHSGREWSTAANAAIVAGCVGGFIAGLLVVLILPALSPQFDDLSGWLIGALFVGAVMAWNVGAIVDFMYTAERSTHHMLVRNVALSAAKVPLVMIPAFVAAKATGIFASWAAPAVLTAVGSVMLLGRLGRGYSFFLRGAGRSIRSLGRSIAANHVITATNLIAITVLPIVVAALVSATESAYYYTAWRVGAVFFMISPAVAASLFAEGSHDAEALPRQTRSAAKVMAALLVPAVLAAILLGRFVLGIFGPGYADNGYVPLVILAASAAPDAATNLYIAVLRVQGRMGIAVAVNVLIAVVTFGLAWLLVPRFGAAGAAWAWLGAQLAACALAAADQWLITPDPRVAQ